MAAAAKWPQLHKNGSNSVNLTDLVLTEPLPHVIVCKHNLLCHSQMQVKALSRKREARSEHQPETPPTSYKNGRFSWKPWNDMLHAINQTWEMYGLRAKRGP